jgi:hypothetical protein
VPILRPNVIALLEMMETVDALSNAQPYTSVCKTLFVNPAELGLLISGLDKPTVHALLEAEARQLPFLHAIIVLRAITNPLQLLILNAYLVLSAPRPLSPTPLVVMGSF